MFVSGGSGGAPHSREREHGGVGVQVSGQIFLYNLSNIFWSYVPGELPPQPLQPQVVQG